MAGSPDDGHLQIDESNFTWKSSFTVREYTTDFEIDVKKYEMAEVRNESFEFDPKSFSKEFSFFSEDGASFDHGLSVDRGSSLDRGLSLDRGSSVDVDEETEKIPSDNDFEEKTTTIPGFFSNSTKIIFVSESYIVLHKMK